MKYINAIIKESLRIHPPAASISPRILSKPTKIGPHIVPENTMCSINIWQVHRHPKYWENPEQYNPERFLSDEKRHPFSWIPFSSGPRNWYVSIVINTLIYYFKTNLFFLKKKKLTALDKIFL